MGTSGSIGAVFKSSRPGRYVVIVRKSTPRLACTGEPASSPRNSPTCHWRARSQTGSRICAWRLRCMEPSRGSGSRRVQVVIEGVALSLAATDRSCTDRLLYKGKIRGDGGALHVQREIESGQNLADLLDAVEINGAALGELLCFMEDPEHQVVIPRLSRVRAHAEEKRLWSTRFRFLVVEGHRGVFFRGWDALGPLVHQQARVGILIHGVALRDAGEGDAPFFRGIRWVDGQGEPLVAGDCAQLSKQEFRRRDGRSTQHLRE